MPKRELVFLSYAKEDRNFVKKIYAGLTKRNLEVWFDEERLQPGKWKPQIEKAIVHSKYFIFCLSSASLKKIGLEEPGFADYELQTAWQIAVNEPENEFTIIPVRLEDCDRGDHRLKPYQQFDLFLSEEFEANLDKLAVALGGNPLSGLEIKDDRTENEKLIDSFLGKATTAYFSGDYKLTLALAETIIESQPDNHRAWYDKGLALYELGRKKEAIDAFDSVTDSEPGNYRAWYNKGLALDESRRKKEAIAAYDKTIEIYPNLDDAWENKASALISLGMYKEAAETIAKLISIHEKRIDAAEASYADDVDRWSSYASSDAAFGHYSESMTDYYDNEVRVSYQSYRRSEMEANEKIESLRKKLAYLKELAKSIPTASST